MNKYIKLSSPFVFLLSLILLLLLKTVPSGKLWKNYSVISVPVNTPDSTITDAMESCGIKNAVALSGQYLPLALSENSVEISMLRLNYNSAEYAYLNKRNSMFFDKSQAYRLYYIPQEFSSETNAMLKLLQQKGINCIKDSSASYPWLLPFIALLLAVMLFLFVKNKLPFAAGAVTPIVFLYSNPFYPIAAATCLSLLLLFFAANVWRRRGAVSSLLHRHSAPAMLGIILICAFSASVFSGFLFLLALLGTGSALVFCWYLEDYLRNRKSFVPVYIRSAKRVSFFAGKVITIMSIVSGTVALFILLVFVTSSNNISTSSAKLLYPGNSRTLDQTLPQFDEYYDWAWKVKTAPYKSLNENNQDSEISFSQYVENEETGIISEKITTMKYDNAFKEEVFEGIDKLQFNSIEKVMKSEGNDFHGGYIAASSYQINLFGIIMCFICLFILLFIYISIIIRKGINK